MCFHYDPSTGRYNFAIMRAVNVLGLIVLGTLVTFMVVNFRRERMQRFAVPRPGDRSSIQPSQR